MGVCAFRGLGCRGSGVYGLGALGLRGLEIRVHGREWTNQISN